MRDIRPEWGRNAAILCLRRGGLSTRGFVAISTGGPGADSPRSARSAASIRQAELHHPNAPEGVDVRRRVQRHAPCLLIAPPSRVLRCRFRPPNLYREALLPICGEVENDADATFRAGFAGPSQKIQKSSESLLTVRRGADYIRLTNEGGAPLATKKFASKSALREIQESRVSDTRTAPKPKA